MDILLACEEQDYGFQNLFTNNPVFTSVKFCLSAYTAYQEIKNSLQEFDMAVIDHDLPDTSGLELCRKLIDENIDFPLILLTSSGEEHLFGKALSIGVESCLLKPSERDHQSVFPEALKEIARRHGDRIARERAVEGLRKNQKRLQEIVQASNVAIFVIDKNHKLTHWNRACEQLTNVPAEKVLGTNNQWRAFYPEPRPVLADLVLDNVLEHEMAKYYVEGYRRTLLGEGYEAEGFFPSLGEKGKWLFFTAAPLRDASNEIVGSIETVQDVTARRIAENALTENQNRLSQIVQGSVVPTFVLDQDHKITEWNFACENLTGLPAEHMIGTRDQWKAFSEKERPVLADFIIDDAPEEEIIKQYGQKAQQSLLGYGFEVENFFPSLGTEGKWLFFTAAPLRDTRGNIIGAIETLQDITRRKKAEEALRASEQHYRELSLTDELTGLFNVRYFNLCINEEIDRADRYERPLTLLMMDIDDFKTHNDTYGHPEGDIVLQRFGKEILPYLRRTDSVYRYGGEEFVVVLPETPLDEAIVIGERIRKTFSDMIFTPIPDVHISKTLSIGLAQWKSGESLKDFIRRADELLYIAKKNGKNQVVAKSPG